MKRSHEFRDPIHIFIRMDSDERRVVDSRPFQRLRCIHQLAMTYLVYPGATHTRFEHSLGVMELATRAFDVVSHRDNLPDDMRDHFPELDVSAKRDYWRRVLRVAALCHDMGHLPFSHAAEDQLLPAGWSHERLTADIIRSEEMQSIWRSLTPPLRADDIAKVAIGPRKAAEAGIKEFSDLESILADIIVGDAFGADRMDYLLRDSHHAGVAYGHFDQYRLIDTLRVLPPPRVPKDKEQSNEPLLGVEEGGLPSAEQMLWARYFMFVQIYYHPIRRIYDRHLQEFLSEWLPGGKFPITTDGLLSYNDVGILKSIEEAAGNSGAPGYVPASRIAKRRHFRVLYQPLPEDLECKGDPVRIVYEAAASKFGVEKLVHDKYDKPQSPPGFPVKTRGGRIASSLALSKSLATLRGAVVNTAYIDPEILKEGRSWLESNLAGLLKSNA